MTFEIHVYPRAVYDLDRIHDYLSDYSIAAADHTCDLIQHAIFELRGFPRRYAQAPESRHCSIELRHLIVGNYRVIFTPLVIGSYVKRPANSACRSKVESYGSFLKSK